MYARIVCQAACILFFVSNGLRAAGTEWYVDRSVTVSGKGTSWETAFRRIQEGIDAASDGDTVIVAQGAYVENIHFNGKNIILRSTDPLDSSAVENTIIDGNESGTVVAFAGTEDETCVLSGFTIRNGKARDGGGVCGGEWEQDYTHARIENNSISGNSSDQHGGGLACCGGAIQNNVMSQNTAVSGGGGLAYCDGTIRGNVIAGNSAESGGGLYCCGGIVQNNTVSGNSATGFSGGGGGLHYCNGTIANNLICGNSAEYGGGLRSCSGVIRNNVIAQNSAKRGGGLKWCSGVVESNTIAGNFATVHGGGLQECKGTIINCIIWGNTARYDAQLAWSSCPTYSCVEGFGEGSLVNISDYPHFVDLAAGDYHLQTCSPCIDAGDSASDFSNEPQPNGGRVNMGAYGNTPEAACASEDGDGDSLPDDWEMHFFGELGQGPLADPDADGVSNLQEYHRGTNPTKLGIWYVDASVAVSGDGQTWDNAFKTIQEGIDAASHFDTVIVAKGTYSENIYFDAKNIVVTSTDPDDPEVVAKTIIDGGGKGSVVRLLGCEDETCVLAGFTIRNGEGTTNIEPWVENFYGAGVYGGGGRDKQGAVPGTLAAIRDNVIEECCAKYGGGVCGCDGVIEGNTIRANSASAGGGGLIWCNGTIQNNVIASNVGSGLRECHGIIQNNTIYGNSYYAPGAGMTSCGAMIRNCIIWGNTSSDGTQVDWEWRYPYQPERFIYCCVQDWARGGEGNIRSAPHFTDPDGGDFHLRSWSPCIDAGSPASEFSNEPEPNGGRVNMGAYGNTPEAASKSPDTDSDSLPDDWELQWFGDLTENGAGDADGDGIANVIEYRHGWNPVVASPKVVMNVTTGDCYQTIQAALFDADDGDEIVVYPGVYAENIKFWGRNVILRSSEPTNPEVAASTVIDGGGKQSVVTFSGTENHTCVVSGFTIRNGNGTVHPTKGNTCGGGIYGGDNPTGATIENNVITGNSAGYGGGIFGCRGTIRNNVITGNSARGLPTTTGGGGLAFCDGTIAGNTISGNSVHGPPGYYNSGGGLYKCNGLIRNNTITGNSANPYGGGLGFCDGTIENNTICENSSPHGGGLYYCDAMIRKNIISENSATQDGGGLECCNGTIESNTISGNFVSVGSGGGLVGCNGTIKNNTIAGNWVSSRGGGFWGCDGIVKDNMITGNSAGRSGGGLYGCNGTIEKNVISGNSAQDVGGGLYQCDGTIKNCLITGNSAPHGGALHSCNGAIQNSTIAGNSAEAGPNGGALKQCEATIVNCVIWGNMGGPQLLYSPQPSYSCIEGFTGGVGNLRCNPYFVDAANGDYHLQSWSPCIDAGDPDSAFCEEPQPNGDRINMGAYGNTPEAASRSPDDDKDGLPDDWETEVFGDLGYEGKDDPDGDLLSNIEEYRRGLNPTVPAALWHVDDSVKASGDGTSWETAFKTIQEGINAASDGDTVVVAEGTYVENVHFEGKNIVLRSTDPGNREVVAGTVIDGNQSDSVVTFACTEDEGCVLSGFTIRNGHSYYGGGICGGTRDSHTHATICYNTITGNSAGDGGGVAACDGAIRFNTIAGNSASAGCDGGGLYRCDGIIERNTIRDNSAGWGGGLAYCNGTIRNSTIFENSAEYVGGLYWCSGTIGNNTIYGNRAQRFAGGLHECGGTIVNCIIWANRGRAQLSECSVPIYSCIQDWTGDGRGNIAFHPHFADPDNGDFHLSSWSPCIDAGDPTAPFSREPEPNGMRVNMGTYGNTPEAACKSADSDADGLADDWELHWFEDLEQDGPADPDGDGIPNLTDYRYGWDPTTASQTLVENKSNREWYQTIGVALFESRNGDEIVVYPGVYMENVIFPGKNVVLRSTDPLDPEVVGDTIIDGNHSGPVVTFAGTENETCVLAGFTIRNGRAYEGGGICGGTWDAQTHATIHNNTITANTGIERGGGLIWCDGAILNNTVSGNSGSGLGKCDGAIQDNTISGNDGGLADCNGTIQKNTISGNRGSGLAGCDGTIRNNVISENKGGGVSWCAGTIESNRISGNSGSGLSECRGVAENNTISGNSAMCGGGLYECQGTIQNNTITNNSATYGGGLYRCEGTIINCIIWGNRAEHDNQLCDSSEPLYCCIEDWTAGGEGNIAEDPRFVDSDGPDNNPETYADNDYHLRPDSPCIDAGTHEAIAPPDADMDGEWRPFGPEIDIGADEYLDADGDDLPDYWERDRFGILWLGPDDDPDTDGLPNGQEFLRTTDPNNRDTDADGESDGNEVFAGTDPTDTESLFRITEIAYTQWGTAVMWSAVPTRSYQCCFSSYLRDWWEPFAGIVTAGPSDTSLSIFDWSCAGVEKRYYKVEVLP